jgi:signal transduction histidine kinase
LELIVKRGRALVDARTVLIMLREGDELVVAAAAGHATDARGRRLPVVGSTSGAVLGRGRPERIGDVESRLQIAPHELGVADARTALIVPMIHHGNGIGVLAAFDHGGDSGMFSAADEQLLRTFAASAANAVALNRSVAAERLRSTVVAADAERGRWARELHDQTLQALGGLRVLLASALRHGDSDAHERAMRQSIEDIEHEIENLRRIITDLRPSLLDDLGLLPAMEALVERSRRDGLQIASEFALGAQTREATSTALTPDLETAIYRLVQEALTNVVKHARASTVRVLVELRGREVAIEIEDNGVGFDTKLQTEGFGLAGIRERAYLAGGSLELRSGEAGTLVRAQLPVAPAAAPTTPRSGTDQVAS